MSTLRVLQGFTVTSMPGRIFAVSQVQTLLREEMLPSLPGWGPPNCLFYSACVEKLNLHHRQELCNENSSQMMEALKVNELSYPNMKNKQNEWRTGWPGLSLLLSTPGELCGPGGPEGSWGPCGLLRALKQSWRLYSILWTLRDLGDPEAGLGALWVACHILGSLWHSGNP